MFYYLLSGILSFDIVLVTAAVVPAVILMVKVYQSDHLEKESTQMLWNLVKAGIMSALLALVEERIFSSLLELAVPYNSPWYQVILYFGVVAISEESSKYIMMRGRTWKSIEFNCQYDGVVYAVFVSLGFALWENISYVMHYGFGTALIRAITAIPGHASFGVFMGVFYGLAKKMENRGEHNKSVLLRVLSIVVPVLLHGAYDYIASTEGSSWSFVIFILVLFAVSFWAVGKASKADRPI
ncbi:MAG: PrsW family intramembrane metalloprotease [Oscillospiraceae bacterium]|jgi:RsiW-degrading membrane proteinase PrsW (M82 family)|nr:PrsW family intramembrane metalloprotease [Oscillospiraceae bacterium]MBQ5522510.1 PrsW family intramembrane metalloprotease [Oscillospiraceae bacterium]